MKMTLITAALAIFLALAGPAAATKAPTVVDRVVAVVNGEVITLSDLEREASVRKVQGEPEKRLLLDDMIDRKIQMIAAKRAGMDVTDKELSEALADIMKRNSMDSAQFEAALAKEGMTVELYRNELREQMTLSRMFNKFVRSGLVVDEREVRAYYERHGKDFSQPEEIRLRQIFFRIPEKADAGQTAKVRQKAEAALDRAKKGEDFERLAKELSENENASLGGDLGFLQRDQVIPEIGEATRAMKAGDIAGPLRYAGGFHIIKLEELRTPVKPFHEVKDEITKKLYEQRMESTYRTWLQTLRIESNIENKL